MRILLVAPIFGDTTRVASRRPRALAEVLAGRGHDVTVISAKNPSGPDAPAPPGVKVLTPAPGIPKNIADLPAPTIWERAVIALSVATTIPQIFVLSRPPLARLLGIGPERAERQFDRLNQKRRAAASTARAAVAGRRWVNETLAKTRPTLEEDGPYDAIWATFGPYSSLWLAARLHAEHISPIWVADLRDPMNKPGSLAPIRLFALVQRRQVLLRADALTTVSKGVRDSTLAGRWAKKWADKVFVLPNGYLQHAAHEDGLKARKTDADSPRTPRPLKIAYTGALYPGRSDPEMLFRAALAASCANNTIEIDYAGPDGTYFLNEAKKVGAEHLVIDHGMLSFEDARALQDASDMLVVLSWNNRGNTGIITGKFPEYVGAGKPIVSIVSGDLPGAELTDLVNQMSLGSAHEYLGGEDEVGHLTDYLRAAAVAKGRGESIPFSPDQDKVARFDYRNLGGRLEALFRMLGTASHSG